MDELRPEHFEEDPVGDEVPAAPIDADVIDRLAAYSHGPEPEPEWGRDT